MRSKALAREGGGAKGQGSEKTKRAKSLCVRTLVPSPSRHEALRGKPRCFSHLQRQASSGFCCSSQSAQVPQHTLLQPLSELVRVEVPAAARTIGGEDDGAAVRTATAKTAAELNNIQGKAFQQVS